MSYLLKVSIKLTVPFICGNYFSHHTKGMVGDTKGVCGTPRKLVYSLNTAAAYLGSREKLRERISGF